MGHVSILGDQQNRNKNIQEVPTSANSDASHDILVQMVNSWSIEGPNEDHPARTRV